ncbi:nucleoside phosphorylase domain-containing protein [Xylariales sp. PMI_506]|nr:nucleoside phosphorylase domain-containing protein [Xylariales sp. PMI_506]
MNVLKALESRDLYTIGWIAALHIERAAAIAVLDERHTTPLDFTQPHQDTNSYIYGKIGEHNVVIACIPRLDRNIDIRLGDIVVSKPSGNSGGVIQCDFGKVKPGRPFKHIGTLNSPPHFLLNALASLRAQHAFGSRLPHILKEICDSAYAVHRRDRTSSDAVVHYGLIASGNTLMKDAATKESILGLLKDDCICFEMEAAGLMNTFPCLVVRGICDYADSHKNDFWQRYAAVVAAAYAKKLLSFVPVRDLEGTQRAADAIIEKDKIRRY